MLRSLIDLASEIADTPIAATDLLYDRYPEAQPWVIRIGHNSVYRSTVNKIKAKS